MDYKALIIYHQIKKGVDCPDGIVSAWIAYRAKLKEYPIEDITVHGRCYDQPLTDKEIAAIKKQSIKEIIIVDFSFDIETLQKLAEFAYITILDHHQTAIDNLTKDSPETSDRILFVYDTNECAATLTSCYLPSNQTWELRSNQYENNTDVAAIAKQFGGSGDRNAARLKQKDLMVSLKSDRI